MSDTDSPQFSQPPVQAIPVEATHATAPVPDGGFTFRIARVQEWTLGAVIAAAVGFGVWMGALNTKLEHLEKFVDSASDGSTGIFVRLATIQRSLDVFDKGVTQASASPAKPSAIEVRLNPSTRSEDRSLDKLIEYKLVEEMLKSEANPNEKKLVEEVPKSQGTPSNFTPSDSASGFYVPAFRVSNSQTSTQTSQPSPSDSSKQQMLLLKGIRETALDQLTRLEVEVKADKKMPEATRKQIQTLIDWQRERVESIQPQ